MPVPAPPDDYIGTKGATKEDWEEFQGFYLSWLETAPDEEILAEMTVIPVEGRPLSPSEAWRYHQCELRRRRPRTAAAKKTVKG